MTDALETVLDAVTALGTLGAVGVTVWVATRERTDRLAAEAREQQLHEAMTVDRREGQARRVAAWMLDVFDAEAFGEDMHRTEYNLVNGSDLPIFDVSLFLEPLAQTSTSRKVHVAEAMGPGDRWTKVVRRTEGELVVEFMDAAGQHWIKEGGRLTPAPEVERFRI